MQTEERLSIALTGTGALKSANQKPSAPPKPKIIQPVLLRAKQQPPIIRTDFDIVKELANLKTPNRCKTESNFEATKSNRHDADDLTKRLLKRSQSLSNKLLGSRNKENNVPSREKERKELERAKIERSPYRESRKLEKQHYPKVEKQLFQKAEKPNIQKTDKQPIHKSENSKIRSRQRDLSLPQITKGTSVATAASLQQVKEQLENEKESKKAQQRREIYALNREMRNLENEMFEAFMASHSFNSSSNAAANQLPILNPTQEAKSNRLNSKLNISDAGRV